VGAGIAIAETSREVIVIRTFMLRTSRRRGEGEEGVKIIDKTIGGMSSFDVIRCDAMWILANLWGFIFAP
jgi:hypothetical protein